MNRSESNEVEFLVLKFLHEQEGPVGSGQLADYLRQHGQSISEATVGRLLRDLDLKHLTSRTGFRGRSLTEAGLARLEELRRWRTLQAYSSELVDALHATRLDQLVDILVARRAIERETARLASQRARPDDMQELERLVSQYEQSNDARVMAKIDLAFHRKLAEMAGNRVLQAATQLVHQEAELVPIPESVSLAMRRLLAGDHRRIMEAIAAKDPQRAEAAMVRHIDEIIRVVRESAPLTETSPQGG